MKIPLSFASEKRCLSQRCRFGFQGGWGCSIHVSTPGPNFTRCGPNFTCYPYSPSILKWGNWIHTVSLRLES